MYKCSNPKCEHLQILPGGGQCPLCELRGENWSLFSIGDSEGFYGRAAARLQREVNHLRAMLDNAQPTACEPSNAVLDDEISDNPPKYKGRRANLGPMSIESYHAKEKDISLP